LGGWEIIIPDNIYELKAPAEGIGRALVVQALTSFDPYPQVSMELKSKQRNEEAGFAVA
jgi:hypothetical protein